MLTIKFYHTTDSAYPFCAVIKAGIGAQTQGCAYIFGENPQSNLCRYMLASVRKPIKPRVATAPVAMDAVPGQIAREAMRLAMQLAGVGNP